MRALEAELVQRLADAPGPPEGSERQAAPSARRRGFDRAIEHTRHAGLSTLNLPELTAAAGISRRTLEYAFQEQLDMSPSSFVRLLRLHGLRRKLLASRLGELTVTEVAYHLGFTELGRLARTYHRLFGERPSATLARPLSGDVPAFLHPALGATAETDFGRAP